LQRDFLILGVKKLLNKLKIELIKEGENKILVPRLGTVHTLIGFFMGIGITMLFLVFASWIGLGSSWGNAPPELSSQATIFMLSVGFALLFIGGWIRNRIKYFTVIDKKMRMLSLRRKFFNWQFEDIHLLRIDRIEGFALKTQAAAVSARSLYGLLFDSWLSPLMGRKSKKETEEDTALIALTKDRRHFFLSSFENGQEIFDAVAKAAQELNVWLGLSIKDRWGDTLLDIPSDKNSLVEELAKWAFLVSFLIYICYLLVTV
jgi:hypothetical protein